MIDNGLPSHEIQCRSTCLGCMLRVIQVTGWQVFTLALLQHEAINFN